MKSKKLIVIIVIVLVGLALVAKLAVRKFKPGLTSSACTKTEQNWTSARTENQVLYVDHCFVPQTLTIKPGTSIIFTDHDDTPMWIESDKKGDKLIVPNFTSGQAWGKGQSYGYSFDKPGTYGYHNRSVPNDKARIIVK